MAQARIVTDSTAELDPVMAEELGITIVPVRLRLKTETVLDSAVLRAPAFHEETIRGRYVPQVIAPSVQEFGQAFRAVTQETDDVVAIQSTIPSNILRPAREAAAPLLGRNSIEVLDATFVSRAMGEMVVEAARAARDGNGGADIVRLVRGLIPRIYFAFFVDSLAQVKKSGFFRAGVAPTVASATARPLLVMEEGTIVPQFRVRNKGSATERLVDFANEFAQLRDLTIVHSGLATELEPLRQQLGESLPDLSVAEHIYGPVLSALLGPKALGIVAVEK
jgi:DegV family protein with EDD domain